MRLFLLPISTRQSILYCERKSAELGGKPTVVQRITDRASQTWASWEKSDRGWKKTVTLSGNKVLNRIPYQEWSLKTVPPLSEKRRAEERSGKDRVEVLFPGLFLKEANVPEIIRRLAVDRQPLHRRRLWWSVVGMPIVIPFALVPVIPNIPFFYLAFRAWSHWRALSGAKHLEFLLDNKLLHLKPSSVLDRLYAAGLINKSRAESRQVPLPTAEQTAEVSKLIKTQTQNSTEDVMLLQRWNGKLLGEQFKLPEMEVEIERAVRQVERSTKAKEELLEEKKEIEQASAVPPDEKKR